MDSILSPILKMAIVKAAFAAFEKIEQIYDKGGDLHGIRALEKNSSSTLFRSFFEIELSVIIPDSTLIEAEYDYYEYHLPNIDLRVCSSRDLYRAAKNDSYDDLPLFQATGINIMRNKTINPKGFVVFTISNHQLIQLSVISRTGDFPEIQLYRKARNNIILDSLSAMRDSTEKRVEFALKENRKTNTGDEA